MTGTGEEVMFWILGPLAVVGALGLVFAKKAVHAALGMALTMITLGVFYIAQGADFLGVIQIFVYTGAVMMLFLFVLMLVGVDSSDGLVETLTGQRWATALLTLGLGGILTFSVGHVTFGDAVGVADLNAQTGNVSGVAQLIFGRYVWVFEITSALLITAALGAMVLAHRERLGAGPNQQERSRRRFQEGKYLAGLPAPGVYARHNAVDTPALLPDGTPSELSVSRVLTARDQNLSPDPYTEGELRARARRARRGRAMSLVNYIYLATILFAVGGATVLVRRNAIIVFMGVELMLNAANLVFVTFARMHGTLDGQVIALFVMVVAAAEVVVGLAIIMAIFRSRRSASVDDANLLKL